MTIQEFAIVAALAGGIGTLLGAVIGSINTYRITRLTLQHQFEMKSAELESMAEIKRRELLFNAYQQRMQRINDKSKEMGEAIGKLSGMLLAITDEEEQRRINRAMFTL